jgi:ferredoxin
MAYVVTGRCVDCRYTYCVVNCPCNCFFEVREPHMLVINPETCTDCDACVSDCPINAIFPDHELPPEYAEWEHKNADLWKTGEQIIEAQDPLDSARLLDEIQEEERKKGWDIEEPSGAAT